MNTHQPPGAGNGGKKMENIMDPNQLPKYRWPNLSAVRRRYLVVDDQGRPGIADYDPVYNPDVIWAHPADVPGVIDGDMPGSAKIGTATAFARRDDGTWRGIWYDYDGGPGNIPPEDLRGLTIIDDLGWIFPDTWADRVLAGSDEDGHWDYGATIAYIPPKRPVSGMQPGEMTVKQAVEYAREVGATVSARGIRKAARSGYIPGARKVGRDWLITYDGINHYLDNRPRTGPKAK